MHCDLGSLCTIHVHAHAHAHVYLHAHARCPCPRPHRIHAHAHCPRPRAQAQGSAQTASLASKSRGARPSTNEASGDGRREARRVGWAAFRPIPPPHQSRRPTPWEEKPEQRPSPRIKWTRAMAVATIVPRMQRRLTTKTATTVNWLPSKYTTHVVMRPSTADRSSAPPIQITAETLAKLGHAHRPRQALWQAAEIHNRPPPPKPPHTSVSKPQRRPPRGRRAWNLTKCGIAISPACLLPAERGRNLPGTSTHLLGSDHLCAYLALAHAVHRMHRPTSQHGCVDPRRCTPDNRPDNRPVSERWPKRAPPPLPPSHSLDHTTGPIATATIAAAEEEAAAAAACERFAGRHPPKPPSRYLCHTPPSHRAAPPGPSSAPPGLSSAPPGPSSAPPGPSQVSSVHPRVGHDRPTSPSRAANPSLSPSLRSDTRPDTRPATARGSVGDGIVRAGDAGGHNRQSTSHHLRPASARAVVLRRSGEPNAHAARAVAMNNTSSCSQRHVNATSSHRPSSAPLVKTPQPTGALATTLAPPTNHAAAHPDVQLTVATAEASQTPAPPSSRAVSPVPSDH